MLFSFSWPIVKQIYVPVRYWAPQARNILSNTAIAFSYDLPSSRGNVHQANGLPADLPYQLHYHFVKAFYCIGGS
jgi:hypothetical protein